MGTLAFTTNGAKSLAAERVTRLTVLTKPTGWRAPGVAVSVGGFAGSGARVLLRADGRVVAFGHCRHARPLPPSVCPACVRPPSAPGAVGREVPSGRHARRPAGLLDAVGDITFGERSAPQSPRGGRRTRGRTWGRCCAGPTSPRQPRDGRLDPRRGRGQGVHVRGPPAALGRCDLPGSTCSPSRTTTRWTTARCAPRHARGRHAAGHGNRGRRHNKRQARRPAIVERGGLKVGFLGYRSEPGRDQRDLDSRRDGSGGRGLDRRGHPRRAAEGGRRVVLVPLGRRAADGFPSRQSAGRSRGRR